MPKLLLTLFLIAISSFAFSDDHIMKTSDELEWKEGPKSLPAGSSIAVLEGDMSKKGPFTVRLKFPANYRIPPHWHPQIEHVTVLDGTFYMGPGDKFDEAKAKELPVGGFSVMPIKFHHFAYTTDEATIVQLHGIGPWDIIYLNPEDDPRKKK